jgi:hypothetical protein
VGRKPIFAKAMSSSERQRRFLDKLRGTGTKGTADTATTRDLKARIRELEADLARSKAAPKQPAAKPADGGEVARLKARIAELERQVLERSESQPLTRSSTRSQHGSSLPPHLDISETGRLRAQIGRLNSELIKLRAALQEEPDTAKLRKQVVEQKQAMASLRQALRRVAKERDEYQAHVARMRPKTYREAKGLLKRQNYNIIVKALHSDRAKHVKPEELAEAERLFIDLKPLFG